MNRKLAAFFPLLLFGLLVLFSVEIAVVSLLKYFTSWMEAPPPVLGNAFAHPFLLLHVVTGVIALVVAPIQLIPAIRERRPRLHRLTGRTYVLACALAAPAGFMLALGTFAGPVAAVGFAIPAVLWPLATAMGVRAAIRRDFEHHRAWMLRSFAICANAITLRLLLPLSAICGFEFVSAYRVIAWLGWMINLAAIELYLRRKARPSIAGGVLAAV
jgi:uncharacterized membrane protein